MKSLEKRFKKAEKENPFLSSYMCFTKAIHKQCFSKKIIDFWFLRLVDKEDYDKKSKKEILRFLYKH